VPRTWRQDDILNESAAILKMFFIRALRNGCGGGALRRILSRD
jgi:hypothetical protein